MACNIIDPPAPLPGCSASPINGDLGYTETRYAMRQKHRAAEAERREHWFCHRVMTASWRYEALTQT